MQRGCLLSKSIILGRGFGTQLHFHLFLPWAPEMPTQGESFQAERRAGWNHKDAPPWHAWLCFWTISFVRCTKWPSSSSKGTSWMPAPASSSFLLFQCLYLSTVWRSLGWSFSFLTLAVLSAKEKQFVFQEHPQHSGVPPVARSSWESPQPPHITEALSFCLGKTVTPLSLGPFTKQANILNKFLYCFPVDLTLYLPASHFFCPNR